MIHYELSRKLSDAMVARSVLEGMENYYPEFGHWYVNKVIPGIVMGRDTLLVARDKHQIVGVAIGKRSRHETKLRCVRVLPSYQSRGMGIHLIERMLRQLGSERPHCTVAEEMLHQFSRPFVNYFNFQLNRVERGLYRFGKLEYVFNEKS